MPPATAVTSLDNGRASLETDVRSISEKLSVAGGSGEHYRLKGAGPTPYSRTADGLAVLRSSVREFLCSEAMHHLGVPTTRALSLVTTGETVVRDMFYDGRPRDEQGAVVCRVAPSFSRFGSFEIFAVRKDAGVLKQLADYTIRTDFPHLGEPSPAVYLQWFREVCLRTAEMIVQWMRVGFVHGVMNTDNMSILGLTIDYGPYGWLENFDPNWTPNTTDAGRRRYRFGNQPDIAHWNLGQFAESILPLVRDVEPLQDALNGYTADFQAGWQAMMARKLGWQRFEPDTDAELVSELLAILELVETDMTLFHRRWHRSMSIRSRHRHFIDRTLDGRLLCPRSVNRRLPQASWGMDTVVPGSRSKRRHASR